ncbi:Protein VACUOLELESS GAMETOPHYTES [Cardamine amara subsp. amara]|uniref:Protein VACUOLELESS GAMETOPHYTES n=1 Tax=Cardamine amara subsp. amara TaxID=228776 RepID=A0ABD1AP68_CARAN
MATTSVKLPIHHHPLSPIVGFVFATCAGCHVKVMLYNSYICMEPSCFLFFHKECAEAPLMINHPSHPHHHLRLTNDSGDGPCDLCGQKLLPPGYSCPSCEFKLDLLCGIKPSPSAIERPLCHDHPLVFLKEREEGKVPCEVCKDSIGGSSYSCLECEVYFHVDCVNLSKEISHPCHSRHPLKLIESDTLTDDAQKTCLLYEGQLKYVYHCSICNFTICLGCTRNPPPLVVEHTKTHKHPLTLFSKKISFTCDICGEKGIMLYICFQCDFVIHGKCIGLPRVININRHDHRISFTPHHGAGYSKCGVCRKYISKYFRAYSCSVCPNYAVHIGCVMNGDVWDGKELEGIPDDAEDIAPFKVVGGNLICHISHKEHTLRLHQEDIINDEHKQCIACSHPVGFGSIYVCEEYCFFLHEKCANLPLKRKFAFDIIPFTLEVVCRVYYCTFCGILSDGFRYTSQRNVNIDVHCGSLSEPLVHDGHIHPLYFYTLINNPSCNGCYKRVNSKVLRCDDCDYNLCFSCASLPEKIWYMNDEHPLTLCCVEKGSSKNNKNWCDNCERELEPRKWFYTCSDCEVSLHVQCVLGDFSRLVPGRIFEVNDGTKYEVVLNNHNTRPSCSHCHSRCKASVILKDRNEDNGYLCSHSCYLSA